VYSRIISGNQYTFGVSGKLIRNALVMYDHQTDTLWSQLLGEAVSGPLIGTQLEYLPAVMTTWGEWKTMYPDTRAIQKGYAGNRDPYTGYYGSSVEGVIGVQNQDDRLGTKEFVIGVAEGDEAVAYPFGVLDSEPVVNDLVNRIPIVVVFDPDSGAGAVWERTLPDGRELTFTAHQGQIVRDLETGSLWNGLTGLATSGDLVGEQLVHVAGNQVFWFAWFDFYPDTRLYGHDVN
jgi:hypothetical protein